MDHSTSQSAEISQSIRLTALRGFLAVIVLLGSATFAGAGTLGGTYAITFNGTTTIPAYTLTDPSGDSFPSPITTAPITAYVISLPIQSGTSSYTDPSTGSVYDMTLSPAGVISVTDSAEDADGLSDYVEHFSGLLVAGADGSISGSGTWVSTVTANFGEVWLADGGPPGYTFNPNIVTETGAGTWSAVQTSGSSGPSGEAPTITTGPLSKTVNAGSAVSFAVTASGSDPLTYQWFVNGTAIAGATSATLQISSAQASNAGTYTVEVSNSFGAQTSGGAILIVDPAPVPPTIVQSPSSVAAPIGAAASFSVQATGTEPLTYQWYFNGASIAGANSADYTVPNVQMADYGSYTVTIENNAGLVTSTVASLSESDDGLQTEPVILVSPLSQTVAAGSAVTFSVSASGTEPLTYQWYFDGYPLLDGISSSLTVANVQAVDAGDYWVTVANSAGTATSDYAVLNVVTPLAGSGGLSAPKIAVQPSSSDVAPGTQVIFIVTATGSIPLSYQWYFNGRAIPGAVLFSYTVNSAQIQNVGNYTVTISNPEGTATSTIAHLGLLGPAAIAAPPLSQTVAAGTNVTLTVAATGTGPLSYQWNFNGAPLAGANSSTLTLSGVQSQNAGIYTVTVTNGLGTVTSRGVTVVARAATAGSVYSWGNNPSGVLGNNSTASSSVPVAVNTASGTSAIYGKIITAVAAGNQASLALASDGTVYSWGSEGYGALGNNSTASYSAVPVAVIANAALAGKTIAVIAAGGGHCLAVASDGSVYSWGANAEGQLGNNSILDSPVPVAVQTAGALAGKTVTAVAGGWVSSIALASDGTVYTWGDNTYGELGNGTTVESNTPIAISANGAFGGRAITSIAMGGYTGLALASDGTLWMWGSTTYGNQAISYSLVPVAVDMSGVLAGETIVAIAAGYEHFLALASDGTVYAWGDNTFGELGCNSSITSSATPVAVTMGGALAGKTLKAIAAGVDFSWALASDGTVYAWGYNGGGALGNNSSTNSYVPVVVNTATGASALAGQTVLSLGIGSEANSCLVVAVPVPTDPNVAILGQPTSQTVASGSTAVFNVRATGGPNYQWYQNGTLIPGATGSLLVVQAAAASSGTYTCLVSNANGSVLSDGAMLTVPASGSTTDPGQATSISTRAFVGTGDNILIGGFYVVGSTSRTVLVQGLGPALGQFGLTGFLAHPTLSIHQIQNGHDVTLYSNTGWGSSPVLLNAAASVFASPVLPANSYDSELLVTLPPGGYSAEVSGADGGSGVALCAIYELP